MFRNVDRRLIIYVFEDFVLFFVCIYVDVGSRIKTMSCFDGGGGGGVYRRLSFVLPISRL